MYEHKTMLDRKHVELLCKLHRVCSYILEEEEEEEEFVVNYIQHKTCQE